MGKRGPKAGWVGPRRQLWLDTGGFTTCEKHGYHNKWTDSKRKNNMLLRCRLCSSDKAKLERKQNPIKTRFDYAKERAKSFKYEFNLDIDYITFLLLKQENRCALSNIPFEEQGKFSFSIDRIDSSKGYTKDNVQLVCQYVNVMKSDMSQDLFVSICKQIANHNV